MELGPVNVSEGMLETLPGVHKISGGHWKGEGEGGRSSRGAEVLLKQEEKKRLRASALDWGEMKDWAWKSRVGMQEVIFLSLFMAFQKRRGLAKIERD